jgi:type IV secretion system protein VirB6
MAAAFPGGGAMIGQCGSPRGDLGLVKGLLDTVDCNVREGVQGGYAALFGPASPVAMGITALLTVYVALLGFRMLTGRSTLTVGDLPVVAIKMGAVILLTTSWASYQSLVFNVLFDGPTELSATLMSGLPGGPSGGGDVFLRLQSAFNQMTQTAAALGDPDNSNPAATGVALANGSLALQTAPGADPALAAGAAPTIATRSPLAGGPAFGAWALWLSAILMLISTLGLMVLAKLMLGFLLAVGPLFVGLLLFDSTKGFFEGWMRTALGFALMPLATAVFMAALLISLDPSLRALAVMREEAVFRIEPVMTVLIIVLTFSAVFATAMFMCFRLVGGFRLPQREVAFDSGPPGADQLAERRQAEADAAPSRAALLAARFGAVAPTQSASEDRRDAQIAAAVSAAGGGGAASSTTVDRRTEQAGGNAAGGASDDIPRLGQSWERRATPGRGAVAPNAVGTAQMTPRATANPPPTPPSTSPREPS